MSIATQAQKSTQANVIQATHKATPNPLVVAFDRFTSMVKGQPCTQINHPNGHITQANATLCAQDRAMAYLATLPESTTQDEALASLGEVTILTLDRFMCLASLPVEGEDLHLKCKFGHKTQAQADKCVGAQAKPSVKAASLITVALGGSLAQAQATTQATPTQATQAQAQAKPRLTSGTQGQVGGKSHPTQATPTQAPAKAK